jgi:hypothetical protein
VASACYPSSVDGRQRRQSETEARRWSQPRPVKKPIAVTEFPDGVVYIVGYHERGDEGAAIEEASSAPSVFPFASR